MRTLSFALCLLLSTVARAEFPSYAVTVSNGTSEATFAAVGDGSPTPWQVVDVVETTKACGNVDGQWIPLLTRSAVGVQGLVALNDEAHGVRASVTLADTRVVLTKRKPSPCGETAIPVTQTTTWSQTFSWPSSGGRGYVGEYEVKVAAQ